MSEGLPKLQVWYQSADPAYAVIDCGKAQPHPRIIASIRRDLGPNAPLFLGKWHHQPWEPWHE